MKNDVKVLIFDLDGTLANTIPAITEAVNMVLLSLDLPPRSESEIKSFIGRGPRHLIAKSLPENSSSNDPALIDKALSLYDETYEKTVLHTDTLYDGMKESIVALSKHYTIAVLSNKQEQYVKALVKQLLPEGICKISCGSLAGIPAKPEPTVALKLADELGVNPNECILIGDSEIDILTAKNAGFNILSVSWGYAAKKTLIDSGAVDIIDSPIELIEYFS